MTENNVIGRCACGGVLTADHLQNECPLNRNDRLAAIEKDLQGFKKVLLEKLGDPDDAWQAEPHDTPKKEFSYVEDLELIIWAMCTGGYGAHSDTDKNIMEWYSDDGKGDWFHVGNTGINKRGIPALTDRIRKMLIHHRNTVTK